MPTTPLPIAGTNFWSLASSPSTVYQDGDVLYVVMGERSRMRIVLRTAEEFFKTTVDRERVGRNLNVVVNGNYYDVTRIGIMKVALGNKPIPASATTPIGLLIENFSLIGGRTAPSLFYVSCIAGPLFGYGFGFGDPPPEASLAGIGGAGPMIINGLKYGIGNVYKPGTPAGAPATGEPPKQFAGNLIQRNNNTYASAAGMNPRTGKTVIAHSSSQKKLVILVQPHGASTGITHDDLRDKLLGVGVDNAVFLDGSDSSMLMVNGVWLVQPGMRKNQTNTIGVGFTVQ